MNTANLLKITENDNMNLLTLLKWEEEFELSVESFNFTCYGRRSRKRKATSDWLTEGGFVIDFKHYFRMEKECFDILVKSLPEQGNIECSETLPKDKRIAIALYALGKTDGSAVASKLFGIPESLVITILDDFCLEVKRVLGQEYMPEEFLTENKIKECVDGFKANRFPQCLGAIGVRHLDLSLREPKTLEDCHTQDWCSNILFALVDYRSRFLYVDDSCSGDGTPSQAFEQSSLKEALDDLQIMKSNSKQIEGFNVPLVLLGDASFELSTTVMTPYSNPKRTLTKKFNSELHNARKVLNNAFQELKARFPRLSKVSHEHNRRYHTLICCCILHNFLNCYNCKISKSWLDEVNQEELQPIAPQNNNELAENIRIAITRYLSTLK